MRTALTIGGSDSSGAAGIQADLKTLTAMGVYGTTAITAITAQNTKAVSSIHMLEPDLIEAQIDAVVNDIKVDAAKTGMLHDSKVINVVTAAIKRNSLYPLVVDPVMVAKSGDSLIDDDAIKTLCKKLLPEAAVITPNRHEAALLCGNNKPIEDVAAATVAAKEICRKYKVRACIIKAIRVPNDQEGDAVDLFYNGEEATELSSLWRETSNTGGAGCTFASAITGALALEQPLEEAIQTAKNLVSEAIRQGPGLGSGVGPVNHGAIIKSK